MCVLDWLKTHFSIIEEYPYMRGPGNRNVLLIDRIVSCCNAWSIIRNYNRDRMLSMPMLMFEAAEDDAEGQFGDARWQRKRINCELGWT